MKKLNTKLSLVLLGSIIVSSIFTGALVIGSQTAILTRQLDEDGRSLAKTIANMSVERALTDDYSFIQGQIEVTALGNSQIVYIRVYDERPRLRCVYPASAKEPILLEDLRVFQSPILIALGDLPVEDRGRVEVGLNSKRYSELIWTSVKRMVAGTLLTFTVLALALWIFLRRNVLQPLAILDRQVGHISKGDLHHTVGIDRDDELGRLGRTIETMRTNLRESYTRIQEQVVALQELDQMKDEFLANTSHELKTPLNGIIGLQESLLLGSYGEVTPEQQQPLEVIGGCATRLWKMTDSILKFSRLHREDPAEPSMPETQYLADHLDEALADLRASAEKLGIHLRVEVPKDFQALYRRDELEQVIRIFVDNAVKYTQQGMIQVLAERWDAGGQSGFQVAVRDSGSGIPTEFQEQIFEPFVQGHSHETRPQGGVGLGLAIASKLVARMQGQIHLESSPGKGSTFTLLLPEGPRLVPDLKSVMKPWPPLTESARLLADRPRGAGQVITTNPPGGSGSLSFHVLVVDDENVNREVCWQALRDEFRVTRAADGESALVVMRSEPVDLVLLDIMMPGMSGYDVLEAMKKDETLAHVSVIVLSAKASREAVIKGLELGAADYLSKPFHRKELLCRIRVHLELKKQQDRLREEVIAKTNALEVAEEASKVKTQFLANMSHEIRTPLNGILGYLQLALDSAAAPERDYLKNVEERTNFLMSIVNDILDMAKIESQEAMVEEAPCVPSEVVNGLLPEWNAEAVRAGLSLEWTPSPTLEEEVHTDPKLLGRILDHVVGNAIKFTPSGHVKITGRCVPASDTERVTLEFQVEDTGIGIPPKKFESIFLPFVQLDSSNTRKYGGSGLGLAISRSLARKLGGDLTVESTPGKGSIFSLAIAARGAEAVAASVTSLGGIARRS